MDSFSVLLAAMALSVAVAAALTTLSRASAIALLAIAPFLYRYRRAIYVLVKTLPRDLKFLWRYVKARLQCRAWARRDATVAELFAERARRTPDAPCVFVVGGRTWTFQELSAASSRAGRVLRAAGLRRGTCVAVLMPNSGEFIASWLAAAKIGAVAALLNTNLPRKPMTHCIKITSAQAIVYHEQFAEVINELRDELPADIKLFQWYGTCPPGVLDLCAEMQKHSSEELTPKEKMHFKDPLLYIYTSGTTGMPKAAIIPNSKYLVVAAATYYMVGLGADDRIYDALPLYHLAGGLVGTAPALLCGVPVVVRDKFSASNYFTDCIKYECTVGQYIGEMCRYVWSAPPRPTDATHRVRLLLGNGMRPALWKPFADRFKIPQINEIYGATEGNANIINTDNTVGAVGFLPQWVPARLLPVAVVRADPAGELVRGHDGLCIPCRPDEPGMLVGIISQGDASRQYHGYINKNESNKKMARDVLRRGDAAFVTGDILVADELGYLYFRDRTGDTFRWRGENVSTAEVEDALVQALGPCSCAVYGVEVSGQEGRAGMAALSGVQPQQLATLARDLNTLLPRYALPLFLRLVDELHVTSTFKLKKLQYQREGFDPQVVPDPLYLRLGESFVPLTPQMHSEILSGKIRL